MDIKLILHWTGFFVFAYIFGYAALYKVSQSPGMMQGMEAIGFGKTGTILIGWAEIIGVLGLLAGVFYPPVKPLAVLWLWPFAIGAFVVHLSYHHPFSEYRNALLVTVIPLLLLATDKHFSIQIRA